ncbi:hypothetical protein BN180_3040003 [Clostridioides difficile E14]|nr:hypothetical protein BN180_3040003 [Clostridioides difficile E14]
MYFSLAIKLINITSFAVIMPSFAYLLVKYFLKKYYLDKILDNIICIIY